MAWQELGGANTGLPNLPNNQIDSGIHWLGTRDADPLIIRTENGPVMPPNNLPNPAAEVMRITPATGLGRAVLARSVGIGTTQPEAKLHVNFSGIPGIPGSEAYPSIHAGGSSAALSFASQTYVSQGVPGAFLPDGRAGSRWQWYASSDDLAGAGLPSSARLWGGDNHLFVTASGQVLLHPSNLSNLPGFPPNADHRVFYPQVPIGTLWPNPPSPPEPSELVLGGTRTSIRGFAGSVQEPGVSSGFGIQIGKHWIRTNGNEAERWMAFVRMFRPDLNPAPTLLQAEVPWVGQGFYIGCDARLKTNVRQVEGALEKLERIRGVAFDWAEAESPDALGGIPGQSSLGVVAQEVEEVFPELVSIYEPEHEYKAANYDGLTSVLIEAVKELKAQNEALRSRIEALERSQK